MRNIQLAAASAVHSVLDGQNLPNALDSALRSTALPEDDHASVRAYSYGTLRQLGYLEFVLDALTSRRPKNKRVECLLLVSLFQLEFGRVAHYAVVDHAVANVGRIGGTSLKSFANAVLRGYLRQREELLQAAQQNEVARYSYPAWWIAKLNAELGQQAENVLRVGNLHPPMTLRVNRRKTGVNEYLSALSGHGISARIISVANTEVSAICLDEAVPVSRLPGFAQGIVSVQDAGAQVSAFLLDVQQEHTVVDACAAPGGKTGHIMELADVRMTAIDHDKQRLQRVSDNLQRLGLQATLKCVDAMSTQSWWDQKPVDRVLLDAPCSASGVVRRHPDVKWLRRADDIIRFAAQQTRLLDTLWKVTARGGKLLYVTCSVFRAENQDQVERFLASHSDARLAPEHSDTGGLLILPTEVHDGFFHALFEKA